MSAHSTLAIITPIRGILLSNLFSPPLTFCFFFSWGKIFVLSNIMSLPVFSFPLKQPTRNYNESKTCSTMGRKYRRTQCQTACEPSFKIGGERCTSAYFLFSHPCRWGQPSSGLILDNNSPRLIFSHSSLRSD